MSNMFALNDGRALCVIVRPMALSSSACTSIDVLASKRRRTQSSETSFVNYAGTVVLLS